MSELSVGLLRQALAGDQRAVRHLIDALTPVVQASAARTLLRSRNAARRDVRQEVRDFVQQVLIALFENDARVLRQWDPGRGRSLTSFVSLVAEREILSALRNRSTNPWAEEPTDSAPALPEDGRAAPEHIAASREALAALHTTLTARLTDRGLDLFYLLVVDERPVEDVAEIAGMTREAVYAWHTRFRRLLRQWAEEREGPASMPKAERRP